MQSLMGHSYGSLEEGDVQRIQMMGTRCGRRFQREARALTRTEIGAICVTFLD